MKQLFLTIGIAVLALGGALVAVFYQQDAYSGTISALQSKAQEVTDKLNEANTKISSLEDDLSQAQKAVNQASEATTVTFKKYTNDKLGISFDYPLNYSVKEELAEDPTLSPGGKITLESADAQTPKIEIQVNPAGSDFGTAKLALYKRYGEIFLLDSLTKIESTMVSDGVSIVAQLPLSTNEEKVESGLTIFYRDNGATTLTEKILFDLISTLRVTK